MAQFAVASLISLPTASKSLVQPPRQVRKPLWYFLLRSLKAWKHDLHVRALSGKSCLMGPCMKSDKLSPWWSRRKIATIGYENIWLEENSQTGHAGIWQHVRLCPLLPTVLRHRCIRHMKLCQLSEGKIYCNQQGLTACDDKIGNHEKLCSNE